MTRSRPQRPDANEPKPDKLMFCPCEMRFEEHTGRGGGVVCTKCSRKMTIAAEFPAGTWQKK